MTRGLAGLVTSAFLFGQVGLGIHFALVRHVPCPEHGELVHADELGHRALLRDQVSTGRDQLPPVAYPVAVSEHEHGHCLLRTTSRERLDAPQTGAPTGFIEAELWPSWVAQGGGVAAIRLYHIAPKHSPPGQQS